jgi:transposase
MARGYSDDLRRKYLEAYDRGEGTLGELALRFGVSQGWGWKISSARKRTGQMERLVGRRGRRSRVTAEIAVKIGVWFGSQPDMTLAELQQRLEHEAGLQLSVGRLWQLLRQLGLRLKKSHSTPRNGTRKPTENGVRSLSKKSATPRRNT